MNKAELITKVINNANEKDVVSNAQMERIISAVFDTIKNEVASGDAVAIAGFGTFKSMKRQATTGRNPSTGETIKIPAKVVPKFVPGKSFKEAVNK